jgi:hypothetical protein
MTPLFDVLLRLLTELPFPKHSASVLLLPLCFSLSLLPSEMELIQSVLQAKEAKFNSADLNIAYRMPVAEYQQVCLVYVLGVSVRPQRVCKGETAVGMLTELPWLLA